MFGKLIFGLRAPGRAAVAGLILWAAQQTALGGRAYAQGAPVGLASLYNVNAAYTDGRTFTGGIDGLGAAYSSNLLGASAVVNGTTVAIGTANQFNGVSNQTISVKEGKYAGFVVLAAAVNGSFMSQPFAVTYTDGTRSQFVQSISDWFAPQNYPGETRAVTMAYRNQSNGTKDNRTFYLYGYSFALDGTRTVKNIVLPANSSVIVLGLSFVTAAPASLATTVNRTGIYTDGTTFSATAGLDGHGVAYSGNQLGTTRTISGVPYLLGAGNVANVMSAGGQTVNLPLMQGSALKVLATGVNGNQTNQTVVVTYTDGTHSTFTQSFSDWVTPASFSGETRAITMTYRNTSTGGRQTRSTYLYGYSFALTSTKAVRSVQFPTNANLIVAAITVAPVAANDTGIIGSCGFAAKGSSSTGASVEYVMVYTSSATRWCVDRDFWTIPGNAATISQFFTFGEAMLQRLQSLFQISPPSSPFFFQVTDITGGASTGSAFGPGITATGDGFYNNEYDALTGQPMPGFFGFLFPLHEGINDFTGFVTPGWPHDWWADHRSPFPNSLDVAILRDVGTTLNNANLLACAVQQHQRFGVPGVGEYDSEVAMFDNFYSRFGGFTGFQNTFVLVRGDGINLDVVAPWLNPTTRNWQLLAQYTIAYLQLGFRTTTDLTQSSFIASGVGTKDTTIASYTPDANAVRTIGSAHCSIRAAQGAGRDVTTQLNALRTGNYQSATATGGTQAACPVECSWNTSTSRCVAKW